VRSLRSGPAALLRLRVCRPPIAEVTVETDLNVWALSEEAEPGWGVGLRPDVPAKAGRFRRPRLKLYGRARDSRSSGAARCSDDDRHTARNCGCEDGEDENPGWGH
jgi:hypothetical protein